MASRRSKLSNLILVVLATLLALPAAAVAATRAKELASLARFQQFAGEPVDRIRSFTLTDWRSLGPTHLAVWRGPRDAWLIRVAEPCLGLEFAHTIGLTTSGGTVSARFDRIEFRDSLGSSRREQCRIEEIRVVDYPKVREAERAARKATAQASGGT